MAQNYDYYYQYIYKLLLNALQANVQIRKGDKVLDLGCGTGMLSHMIWKTIGLKIPIVCIEPSEEMIRAANSKEGLTTQRATAEKYVLTNEQQVFHVILITNSFHHFQKQSEVLLGIKKMLAKDGCAVITTHRSQLPMIRAAEAYLEDRVDSTEPTLNLIEEAGLKGEVKLVVECYNIDKSFWYEFMRRRMYSFYRQFTDKKIEDGIKELEQKHGDADHIKITSVIRLIIITQ